MCFFRLVQVKHLDYDDLHVTQAVREEGLRGGGNRGGRGLDMADARYEICGLALVDVRHDRVSLCTFSLGCDDCGSVVTEDYSNQARCPKLPSIRHTLRVRHYDIRYTQKKHIPGSPLFSLTYLVLISMSPRHLVL